MQHKYQKWLFAGRKKELLRWFPVLAVGVVLGFILMAVPRPLFDTPCSTLLETGEGHLLGARIAPDGQWRFPAPDSVPYRFEKALLQFEDRHFYRHPGINPVSLAKALVRNIRAGRVVSGGSTVTMQVARMARQGKPRNLANKLTEMIWALNLEIRFSKKEIMTMYAANAPFGGNVVGLEAAAWRYYHRPPHLLSWGEAALLAVLPNAPSLIFPGKNDTLLINKRNRLLDRLLEKKTIDTLTCDLAKSEPVPQQVYRLPDEAYHLLESAAKKDPGKRIRTTLNPWLQQQVNEALLRHATQLAGNNIHNAAAMVAEVRTGKVLAYTGNVPSFESPGRGHHVDIIRSPRSSGSILKPFLYAAMSDRGMLAPNQLIADIPTRFGGFSPMNFSRDYDGAVPASEALARSLNVPAVKMLQQFGVDPFFHFLGKAGMTTLNRPASHYGLSLILGGAETTLWDLGGMYASLARIAVSNEEKDGFYPVNPFQPLIWEYGEILREGEETSQPFLKAGAVWLTIKALQQVTRPDEETGWENFAGTRHIAWKTGTSFGFRDGWAVGFTKDHVVAVWTGNAYGEGRPGLTGTATAAPLMFTIFGMLPASGDFSMPADELVPVAFCRQSGFLPSPFCDDKDTLYVPANIQTGICPYHQPVHLDSQGRLRVTSNCWPVAQMITRNWFVLPPVQEYFYRRKHPEYRSLPAFMPGCGEGSLPMELIYPREMNRIFIPRQLDGSPGEALFEIAHRNPETEIHWFVDEEFAGTTTRYHQMNLRPGPGWHVLTATDQHGNQLKKRFQVVQTED
ncbi:MAG: penicillin-binding protein 1C [Bacteroidota bacterium]